LFADNKKLPMQYSLDKNDKYALIKLHEQKLNTLISAELKSELLIISSQGYTNIILDLSDTQYCDSSGLSAVLVGNRVCRNANGSFILTGLSEAIQKLISISQLDQVLTITPSLDKAVSMILVDEADKS
jgi:anti-anti-sigma factor